MPRAAIALCLPLALLAAGVFTAGPGETESLYVTVERDGGIVQGLTARNFHLYEEGEARPFQLETPEIPASIVFLVEYSRSSWYYISDIVYTMQAFTRIVPEGHWYALATFAHEVQINVDFTKQRGQIADGFATLSYPMWNEIDTYDAIYQIADKLERLKGRRILVLIASGFDTFSAHTMEEVLRKLESVNVVVYVAGAGSSLRGRYEPYLGTSARLSLLQAEAFLNGIADKSGGQAFFPRFESAFPDVLRGIMQMVENQYRLIYTPRPPAKAGFQKIRVEAFRIQNDRREDFKVRVRSGWRYGIRE